MTGIVCAIYSTAALLNLSFDGDPRISWWLLFCAIATMVAQAALVAL